VPAEKPTPEERLAAGEGLRIGEVAELTGYPRGTIHDWIRSKRWQPLYTRTLGGQRRFKAESVRKLLAELREERGGDDPQAGSDTEAAGPGNA
jgi:excisionase family DNA binding protein